MTHLREYPEKYIEYYSVYICMFVLTNAEKAMRKLKAGDPAVKEMKREKAGVKISLLSCVMWFAVECCCCTLA